MVARLRSIEPYALIERIGARVDLFGERMGRSAARDVAAAWRRLESLGAGLRRGFSAERLPLIGERVTALGSRLEAATARSFERKKNGLERAFVRLESASPRRVLERGFAIVERDGAIVRGADEVHVSDNVRITLGRGSLGATVTQVEGVTRRSPGEFKKVG